LHNNPEKKPEMCAELDPEFFNTIDPKRSFAELGLKGSGGDGLTLQDD
jgi:hypothetical protein